MSAPKLEPSKLGFTGQVKEEAKLPEPVVFKSTAPVANAPAPFKTEVPKPNEAGT